MNNPLKGLDWALQATASAIVVSSVTLAWWLVYGPLDAARVQALGRCDEIAAALEGSDQLRTQLAELNRSLADARRQEEALLARVPGEAHEAEFLGQISHLAKQVGMGLRDYRPGQTCPQTACSAMEVALTCEGSYEALCRFLDGLSRLPRLANLSRLDLDASRGTGDYTAMMKLMIYFRAAETAAPAKGNVPHG